MFGFERLTLSIWKAKQKEKEYHLLPKMVYSSKCPLTAGLGQAEARNQELHGGSLRLLPWAVFSCLQRHISRELDWKGGQGLPALPHRIPALQQCNLLRHTASPGLTSLLFNSLNFQFAIPNTLNFFKNIQIIPNNSNLFR